VNLDNVSSKPNYIDAASAEVAVKRFESICERIFKAK